MSINVRCAGLPAVDKDLSGQPLDLDAVAPCGWKGERRPFGYLNKSLDLQKPCPRCGGRVELITTDGAA